MYAYIVLAHRDITMLNKLIKRLIRTGDVYVHVDASSKLNVNEISSSSKIHLVMPQVSVHWGGYSIVQATLNCIQSVLDQSKQYNKIVLVSGQDYPVKSDEYIQSFFNEENYIRGFNISEPIAGSINRVVDHYFFNDSAYLIKKTFNYFSHFKRLKKDSHIHFEEKNWDVYEGSQWWGLNQDVLVSLMDFLKTTDGMQYIKQMRHLHAPDEKFFTTYFFNSEYWNSNVKRGPEEFPFKIYKGYQGTNYETTAPVATMYNFHRIHLSLSKVYTLRDWKVVRDAMEDSKVIFIRKISTDLSDTLVDNIDNFYKDRIK